MNDEYQTIKLASGVIKVRMDDPIIIDPPCSTPALYGPGNARWSLTPELVGMLERVCLARYGVSQLVPGISESWTEAVEQSSKIPTNGDPIQLDTPEEVIGTIAQSVYASTKIEGEEIYANDVPLAIVGRADVRQAGQDDYELRCFGAQDLYKAYIWALSRPFPFAGGGVITKDFILDLHNRMFTRTKPAAAGHLKTQPNQIAIGGKAVLKMLPPEKTNEFVDALCGRINNQFQIADSSGQYSKLIAVGEFVVDFLAIHPFDDGNGRIARLLSTYLLERAGFHFARFYSLDSVILDRHARYYQSLMDSQRNWYTEQEDTSPWIGFYLLAVFTQWLRAHDEIRQRQIAGS